jgi:hypothetical protein
MVIWKYLFSSNFYYLNLSKNDFKKLIREGEVMIQKKGVKPAQMDCLYR